jgi:hypothetical protein
MVINASGNVGINANSPASKLDVYGAIRTTLAADTNYYGSFTNSGGDVLVSAVGTGANLQLQTAGTTRLLVGASGGIQTTTTISVGNATPSSSGAGITFPATQSASSDANTLDDYEEGTWTPSFFGTVTAGSPTYTNRLAAYTKVGRSVSVTCYMSITNKGGMAGNLQISGLPFTAISGGYYSAHAVAEFSGLTFASGRTQLGLEQSHSATTITVYSSGSGVGDSQQTIANTDDSTFIIFAGTYFTS